MSRVSVYTNELKAKENRFMDVVNRPFTRFIRQPPKRGEEIFLNAGKSEILMTDPSQYHLVARYFERQTLNVTGSGRIFYNVGVSDSSEDIFPLEPLQTTWDVLLSLNQSDNFLREFGEQYQLNHF